jgi:predicted nucleic acid-binding Zn ribbon protein
MFFGGIDVPIYVYKNLTTGETFELEQRITEKALSHHPETGDPVKRLIQPVGIAFKGSGFYVNDSRNGSNTSSSKTENKTEKTSDTKGESKTETKTEAKPESKLESKKESKASESKTSSAGASS